MNRRELLQISGWTLAGLALEPRQMAFGLSSSASEGQGWRHFEIATRVQMHPQDGSTFVWVPGPLLARTPFQRTLATRWDCASGRVTIFKDEEQGSEIVRAEFPAGATPDLTVTRRVACRNWRVDLGARTQHTGEHERELQRFRQPSRYVPTDGVVKERADQITRGAKSDLDKARFIYEWIVENTYRKPTVRGCGVGDIRFMLESGDLGGKCADLNALFVGLARAAGLPARDVYGIRVAPSQLGYKSLGASSQDITHAQHCRAEVYLTGYGWTPVDPADVRKVMLEEPPGHLPLEDAKVQAARQRLFGSWEMNWMAYNYAQDVMLPGSKNEPVHFLMYPQAETGGERADCLDPAHFQYRIEARELSSVGS